jgi:hypothetical protein
VARHDISSGDHGGCLNGISIMLGPAFAVHRDISLRVQPMTNSKGLENAKCALDFRLDAGQEL